MDNQEIHEDAQSQAKAWIQENLRIIVSVFIVAAIALGIYSYSQRTEIGSQEDEIAQLLDTKGGEEETAQDMDKDGAVTSATTVKSEAGAKAVAPELSRETETSFIEQAERGNGTTHLARRALLHQLEKNPDSSLTAEHKVYIEDYLRKNVGFSGRVTTDTSIEFSKDLIQQAIDHSKTLNDRQLNNLKQYSRNVSAYR
ncbi:MAG: hypothetical protein A2808_01325 [Candidatus Moranbacteria bacterium RIFCSPHIGHO2_01_FULL_55_24]|nr:MAG: hypothetical protein A2808_01325 [Candidatus Moranbacteria bacterium RIFCSPHIGHO2_01_FULL_55_24]